MYINATGADYAGFNPANSGLALPAVGVYRNLKLEMATITEGMTKGDAAAGKPPMGKIDITFNILSGELDGTQFKLTYSTGHHKPEVAVIAVKSIISLVYGITGVDNTNKQFHFDKSLCNKPFTGTLEVTNQAALDSNGTPYRNGNLKGIKPFDYTAAPIVSQAAPVVHNATPQQAANDRPAWAGPQA